MESLPGPSCLPSGPPGAMRGMVLASALTVLAAIGLPGCDESDDPVRCTHDPSGALCGYVRGAGGPVQAEVTARGLGDGDVEVLIRTTTDSTGRYELCLPTGEYSLAIGVPGLGMPVVYGPSGPGYGPRPGIVLDLGDDSLRVDFDLGGVVLDLCLPECPRNTGLRLELRRRIGSVGMSIWRQTTLTTGDTVHVDVPALLPGHYALSMQPDVGPAIWFPHTREPAQTESLVVSALHTAAYEDTLPEPTWIHGQVSGSWQELGDERLTHLGLWPSIEALDPVTSDLRSRTWAAQDGSFTVYGILPEPFRLRVRMGDLSRYIGGDSFETATVFDLEPGNSATLDPVVESGLLFTLHGSDPEDRYKARIRVESAAGDTVMTVSTGCSGGDELAIPNLDPGVYYLHLSPTSCIANQTWVPQWFDRVDAREEATPVQITEAGELVSVAFHLEDGGRIRGTVRHSDGTFVGDYLLRVFAADDSTWALANKRVDPVTGAFCTPSLEDGAYRLALWTKAQTGLWYPGVASFEEAEVLTIADHQDLLGLDWEIDPHGVGGR